MIDVIHEINATSRAIISASEGPASTGERMPSRRAASATRGCGTKTGVPARSGRPRSPSISAKLPRPVVEETVTACTAPCAHAAGARVFNPSSKKRGGNGAIAVGASISMGRTISNG